MVKVFILGGRIVMTIVSDGDSREYVPGQQFESRLRLLEDDFPLVTGTALSLTGQLEESTFTVETQNEPHTHVGTVKADE